MSLDIGTLRAGYVTACSSIVALSRRLQNVTKQRFQFPKMASGRRVNNDGPAIPGTLDLLDAQAVPLESSSDLRGTEVYE